jgi:hypothetical protein
MSETNPFTQVPMDFSFRVLGATAAVTSATQDKWANLGITVRGVRGRKMRTTQALFDEVSAALQFPHYFGENWHAFEDCICDLDWLLPSQGIILLIYGYPQVLADDNPKELSFFIKKLGYAMEELSRPVDQGDSLDRPAVPFHIVLQSDPDDEFAAAASLWASWGAKLIALDLPTE